MNAISKGITDWVLALPSGPGGSGDMLRGIDGVNIANSTATITLNLTNFQGQVSLSTGTILTGIWSNPYATVGMAEYATQSTTALAAESVPASGISVGILPLGVTAQYSICAGTSTNATNSGQLNGHSDTYFATQSGLNAVILSTVTAGVQVPSIAQYNATALSTGNIVVQMVTSSTSYYGTGNSEFKNVQKFDGGIIFGDPYSSRPVKFAYSGTGGDNELTLDLSETSTAFTYRGTQLDYYFPDCVFGYNESYTRFVFGTQVSLIQAYGTLNIPYIETDTLTFADNSSIDSAQFSELIDSVPVIDMIVSVQRSTYTMTSIVISTSQINATGTATAGTYLQGNGSWATPVGSGDMLRAVDGLVIGLSTASIQSQLNSVQYSTFTVASVLASTNTWTRANTFTQATYGIVPTGSVIEFYGSTTSMPTGFLYANGQAVSRTTYAGLFLVIGVSCGAGNGTTTFNVPDKRGVFTRGLDDGRGLDPDGSFRVVGSTQSNAFQGHWHDVWAYADGAHSGYGLPFGGTAYSGTTLSIYPYGWTARGATTDGTNGTPRTASETRPDNIAVVYIIKY